MNNNKQIMVPTQEIEVLKPTVPVVIEEVKTIKPKHRYHKKKPAQINVAVEVTPNVKLIKKLNWFQRQYVAFLVWLNK